MAIRSQGNEMALRTYEVQKHVEKGTGFPQR